MTRCKDVRPTRVSFSLNIKPSSLSPPPHPISQWPPPSQHTLLLSLSPHPTPPPLAQSSVASPLQLPLPNVRSPPSSSAMTPAYPLPPTSVVARSVVSQALDPQRKRLARSGLWKRPKCSSRVAIAYVLPSLPSSYCGVTRAHLPLPFPLRQHGVGNWKAILNDPSLHFDNRSPVDLKDR